MSKQSLILSQPRPLEQSAFRDGYHEYPDEERKVISKLDVKRLWGKKSAENISSSFDLESVVELWKRNLRSRSGNKAKDSQMMWVLGYAD
ncbi:unnamed protein product, partial [Clonostachys rhizophaga]